MNNDTDKKQLRSETDRCVAEFLAKGGHINIIPQGRRTEPQEVKAQWGKPKKKTTSPYDNKE